MTEKKDKRLSAHNQIDTGNLLSNVLTFHVRTISDFRELNKRTVRKPYPIPKISTMLQELEGFTYATALHLNMGYLWGKYSYLRLPMGFAGSADIFKRKWEI